MMPSRRFAPVLALSFALSALLPVVGCSGDDAAPQEPVAVDPNDPSQVDPSAVDPAADAAAAAGGGDEATPPPAAETPAEDAPAGDDQPSVDDQYGDGEPTGSLTEDELGTPKNVPQMQDDTSDAGDYGGYNEQPAAPAPKASRSGKSSATASSKGKTARYVDAIMLNVRAQPTNRAKVVRRLLGGAKINVEVQGSWAKIKNGQWVRTRYLSSSPTRKVSRSEADAAWKGAAPKGKGKSKATAQPKAKAKSKTKSSAKASKAPKAKAAAAAPAPAPSQDATPMDEIDAAAADPADPIEDDAASEEP